MTFIAWLNVGFLALAAVSFVFRRSWFGSLIQKLFYVSANRFAVLWMLTGAFGLTYVASEKEPHSRPLEIGFYVMGFVSLAFLVRVLIVSHRTRAEMEARNSK
ncbi:hypothetical protein ACQPZJ_21705 [Actinoplanes sp. CA-054009]